MAGIVVGSRTYDGFKVLFSNLGGNKKTPVIASDNTAIGGAFDIAASFIGDGIVASGGSATKPPTFDADFPQAVYADSVQFAP